MPAAVAVPLIASAIGGGTSLVAAKMGSNASNKASKTAAAAADEALKWEKSQHFAEEARLQPYRELGGQAYARMGQTLGLGGGPTPQGAFSFRPQPAGAMVKIRHPRTGEV